MVDERAQLEVTTLGECRIESPLSALLRRSRTTRHYVDEADRMLLSNSVGRSTSVCPRHAAKWTSSSVDVGYGDPCSVAGQASRRGLAGGARAGGGAARRCPGLQAG